MPPKAESVDKDGNPDGFVPPAAYHAEVIEGGLTRLVVSVPPSRLADTHRALLANLEGRWRVLYVRLTDRKTGQLQQPEHHVALELHPDTVIKGIDAARTLVYEDGRHQLWIREQQGPAQVVLDELGMLYAYPDDVGFRDALEGLGLIEGRARTIAERDYVKVHFETGADPEEEAFLESLGLRRWER